MTPEERIARLEAEVAELRAQMNATAGALEIAWKHGYATASEPRPAKAVNPFQMRTHLKAVT